MMRKSCALLSFWIAFPVSDSLFVDACARNLGLPPIALVFAPALLENLFVLDLPAQMFHVLVDHHVFRDDGHHDAADHNLERDRSL
jgi:hypothetical protein